MERWRVYGSIQNPYVKVIIRTKLPSNHKLIHVKRRTTTHTPAATNNVPKIKTKPAAAAAAAKEATMGASVVMANKERTPEEGKSGRSTPQSSLPTTLKRTDSKSKVKKDTSVGNLFKSFAKTKPKKDAEKPKEEDGKSRTHTWRDIADAISEPMQGMSEDEGDSDDEPAVKFDAEKAAAAKKAREERERKLQEMMEADGRSAGRNNYSHR